MGKRSEIANRAKGQCSKLPSRTAWGVESESTGPMPEMHKCNAVQNQSTNLVNRGQLLEGHVLLEKAAASR